MWWGCWGTALSKSVKSGRKGLAFSILLTACSVLAILTNTIRRYRYGIDTSGIKAEPARKSSSDLHWVLITLNPSAASTGFRIYDFWCRRLSFIIYASPKSLTGFPKLEAAFSPNSKPANFTMFSSVRNSALAALLLAFSHAAHSATPAQWRSRPIYQVFTDRFTRTDLSTAAPCASGYGGYCGGTWQGIISKLDYIQVSFDAR
jgi:hypothetical protein